MRSHNPIFSLVAVLLFSAVSSGTAAAQDDEKRVSDKDLQSAKVSLEDGLKASEAQGTPLSAKFELDKGTLQLSVYTMKDSGYSEVIVDYKSGKVIKTEPITEGDDLKAAQEQSAAMGKAKESLRVAVGHAVAANKGSRAVRAVPAVENGHPVAKIVLVKGKDSRAIVEKLD